MSMQCRLTNPDDVAKADVFCINHVYLNGNKCSVFISSKNKLTGIGRLFLNNEVTKEYWEIINE